MKVSGIDYGLGSPWEIEVPDSAMVVEGPHPDRIPRALENPAQAVRDAIRKPMGMKPLAELVTASSKVTIALTDWMGVGVHSVSVVPDERLVWGACDLGRLPGGRSRYHRRPRKCTQHHDPPRLSNPRAQGFHGFRCAQAALHEAQGSLGKIRRTGYREESLLPGRLTECPVRVLRDLCRGR